MKFKFKAGDIVQIRESAETLHGHENLTRYSWFNRYEWKVISNREMERNYDQRLIPISICIRVDQPEVIIDYFEGFLEISKKEIRNDKLKLLLNGSKNGKR